MIGVVYFVTKSHAENSFAPTFSRHYSTVFCLQLLVIKSSISPSIIPL